MDNLFSLFISINARIPIFRDGKIGCSKSLSIQSISNVMKWKTSNKEVFNKARKILEVEENKEKIIKFYFD